MKYCNLVFSIDLLKLFFRLYGNKPALDLIKMYLVKYEQQPLEVQASELMKKCLHEFNFNNRVSILQVYEVASKKVDQNFLFDMTFEASFIDDFYQELHKFEYLEESSTDESSSAE